jgi:hypothetical protein
MTRHSRLFALLAFTLVGACGSFGATFDGGDGGDGGAAADSAAPFDGAETSMAEGGDAAADSASTCPGTTTLLGEYATWQGKVNVHRAPGAAWAVDDDCASGAEKNTVLYCQKFWDAATVQHDAPVSDVLKPFANGGNTAPNCGGLLLYRGDNQFACCK